MDYSVAAVRDAKGGAAMTKTPEEIAEENIKRRWKISEMPSSREGYVNTLSLRIAGYRDGFIDGYQAAKYEMNIHVPSDQELHMRAMTLLTKAACNKSEGER